MIGWGKYIKKGSKKNYCPFLLITIYFSFLTLCFIGFAANSK
jgi:hypothetical protein